VYHHVWKQELTSIFLNTKWAKRASSLGTKLNKGTLIKTRREREREEDDRVSVNKEGEEG